MSRHRNLWNRSSKLQYPIKQERITPPPSGHKVTDIDIAGGKKDLLPELTCAPGLNQHHTQGLTLKIPLDFLEKILCPKNEQAPWILAGFCWLLTADEQQQGLVPGGTGSRHLSWDGVLISTCCDMELEPCSWNKDLPLHLPKVAYKQSLPKFWRQAEYEMSVNLIASCSKAGRRNMQQFTNKRHCQTTLALKGNIKVSFTLCPGFL